MNYTYTFLLVDDDNDDIMLFGEVLEAVSPGIQLLTAVDGQDALDKLRNSGCKPSLVFLDLNMPRMDGKECLSEIKNDPELCDIPVIIYTTSSHSADVEQTMQMGAMAFITKPSHIKELRNIIHSLVESLPKAVKASLQKLSENPGTFIIC